MEKNDQFIGDFLTIDLFHIHLHRKLAAFFIKSFPVKVRTTICSSSGLLWSFGAMNPGVLITSVSGVWKYRIRMNYFS
jgi:hypothetical protein